MAETETERNRMLDDVESGDYGADVDAAAHEGEVRRKTAGVRLLLAIAAVGVGLAIQIAGALVDKLAHVETMLGYGFAQSACCLPRLASPRWATWDTAGRSNDISCGGADRLRSPAAGSCA